MRVELSKESVEGIRKRLTPTAEKMLRVAEKARDQVHERYDTAGQSGGVTWPPDKSPDAEKPPLSGLCDTWEVEAKEGEASTYSTSFLAPIHNYGRRDGTIPPRPQIPNSDAEQAAMGAFVVKTLAEK